MTAEAQRIAIAEACGIQVVPCTCTESPWKNAATGKHIPDYLNDLNACCEFEEKLIALGPPLLDTYQIFLLAICTRAGNRIFRATAAQRCEAFLKTINKWTNDR